MSTQNTGTDGETPTPEDDGTGLFSLVINVEREARSLDALDHGAGRAAWVLDQVNRRANGELVLWPEQWGTDYSCQGCGRESDHNAVQVVVQTGAGGAGVLAGPLCPTCGVRRLKESLR